MRFQAGGDVRDLLFPADVSGVDPQFIGAVLDGEHGKSCRKMHVGNDGNVHARLDGGKRQRVPFVRNGNAHDVAPRLL